MRHFRQVPRAVLWRNPGGLALRLARWRTRRPVGPRDGDEPTPSVVGLAAADDRLGGARLRRDCQADEVFEAVPVMADAARTRVRRQLDRLVTTYNCSRAKPM